MVKHLAIELMKRNPPRDLLGNTPEQWVEQYVAGHQSKEDKDAGLPHAQFSYVPQPSTGFHHTNPAVRRVMIVAPAGDESWLDHLAVRLDGQLLKPLPGTTLPHGTRLQLIPADRADGVRDAYTGGAHVWASFTPVILPGHDDHKPAKTRKLIEKALLQSGIEQPCEFEWSAFSRFPKALSAHKYDRQGRPTGYIRPDHLLNQTAVHLTLHFGRREDPNDPESRWIPAEQPVPGPLTIGAGRHCGFGLMAAVRDQRAGQD
jgi:CRISPR-associated protein Csb2